MNPMTETDPTPVIPVLVVEDNPGDARLVELALTQAGDDGFRVDRVSTLADALAHIEENAPQAVLLDLSLPDSHGMETLARLRDAAPNVPVLVLTGTEDSELAMLALKAGAQDYLVKGDVQYDLLRRALRYAIERQRSEAAERESKIRFQAVFENVGMGIAIADPQGRITECNKAFQRFLGYGADELLHMPIAAYSLAEDWAENDDLLQQLYQGRRDGFHMEKRYRRKDGEIVWGHVMVSAVRDSAGRILFTIGVHEDITDRKRMEDRLRLSATVLEVATEGIFVTDAQWRIIHVNPAFTHLTGYDADEALGQSPRFLASGRQDDAFFAQIWATLARTGRWSGEVWNRRKNGEVYAAWLNISAVIGDDGDVVNYVSVFSDITWRKRDEEKLSFQANHDPLTSLPNRPLFHERLSRALARGARNASQIAVFFLDIDHFKEVNDTLGHHIGDQLLQSVAERLSGCIRQGDTLARLAGDEFTVILEDLNDFADAASVAHKILRQCNQPFSLDGHDIAVSASIGVALYPRDGTDLDTLLRRADQAMYSAKKLGKNNYQFFAAELNELAFERFALESSLRRAVERQELVLYWQAMVDLASGRVVGAEALVRWHHPDIGLVTPHQFLVMANATGLIGPIGNWVIEAACAQAMAWTEAGLGAPRIGVNLSASQLRLPDLPHIIDGALRASGIEARRLELDVPEEAFLDLPRDTAANLTALRHKGVRIALDDFGTGSASLTNLKSLPVDCLKIDPSFLRDITTNNENARIFSAFAAVARGLGMDVVAKGVENRDQVSFLRNEPDLLVQGYHFGHPLPTDEFTSFLALTTVGGSIPDGRRR